MIGNDWDNILSYYFNSDVYKKLINKVKQEYENNTCYPKYDNIFKAFKLTSYNSVKVVIIGQDPYHEANEASGLAFSVNKNIKIPPSLKNIYKELYSDIGVKRETGDLSSWAEEGILLLNSILTVEEGKALSHKNIGWLDFTNEIIRKLNEKETPLVFVLWGNDARSKKKLITNKKHLIIESVHPSPLSASRGFIGSKPFSKINAFLISNNIRPINFN